MGDRNILSTEYVSLPEVKEVLNERLKSEDVKYEQEETEKYAKEFSKLSADLAKALREELSKIDVLDSIAITKIIDILPETKDDLLTILPDKNKVLEAQKVDEIMEILEKYKE